MKYAFILLVCLYGTACRQVSQNLTQPVIIHQATLPLRVVAVPDSPQQFLGYVLYSNELSGPGTPRFCVVTKSIDPDTEDYKEYCKCIIQDIARSNKLKSYEVVIYDSNQAFIANENLETPNHWILTDEEAKSVYDHVVASYSHNIVSPDWNENNLIRFYQYASNSAHASQEEFTP